MFIRAGQIDWRLAWCLSKHTGSYICYLVSVQLSFLFIQKIHCDVLKHSQQTLTHEHSARLRENIHFGLGSCCFLECFSLCCRSGIMRSSSCLCVQRIIRCCWPKPPWTRWRTGSGWWSWCSRPSASRSHLWLCRLCWRSMPRDEPPVSQRCRLLEWLITVICDVRFFVVALILLSRHIQTNKHRYTRIKPPVIL